MTIKRLTYLILTATYIAFALPAGAGQLLPNAEQTFFDTNGRPLASGKVYTYIPNTLTPKNTWQDSTLSTLNNNPITLDAAGRAIIWGDGIYRQIVNDRLGNQMWDQVTSIGGGGSINGPNPSVSGSIACFNNLVGTLLKDCSLINDGAITNGNLAPLVATANSTSVTAALIRAGITGNVQRDVNQSVVYIAPGSTVAIADANAYSAYVRSDMAGGAGDNGVGFKVMAVCNSTVNCQVFGGNSILTDSLVNNVITATAGQALIGWEYDFGVTSPNTNVSGINFQLQGSISQPAGANAMACAPNVAGTIHWTYCMVSNNGATAAGGAAIYVGSQSLSGANKLSQLVQYGYFDAASVGRSYNTGVNAAQQFYLQTSAGAGLSALAVDGNFLLPQTGQISMGVDTIIGSAGANSVTFGNGGTLTTVAIGNGSGPVLMNGSVFRMTKYIVANLPTCNGGNEGAEIIVIDANSTTYNSVAAGGGANRMPVVCDTVNWRLH